jgi:hypothetical protein
MIFVDFVFGDYFDQGKKHNHSVLVIDI